MCASPGHPHRGIGPTDPGRLLVAFAGFLVLSAAVGCSDSNGNQNGNGFAGIPSGGGGGGNFMSGVFPPATQFIAQCANPRTGTDPNGNPWPDLGGSSTDENNFLRSYSNDTYLWYDEIMDRDPSQFATPDYFDLLKTTATTASGAPKDDFHFTQDTDEFIAQSQSGTSGGYGAEFVLLENRPPRNVVVAFTQPNSPATTAPASLARGARLLEIDGVDVINGDSAADVDTLNAGLFPANAGEVHQFRVRDLDGTERTFSMTSAIITSQPVQNVSTLTTATGDVGYLLFNEHIATSEQALFDAVTQLDAANITDLVVDIRYNGGGFLDIAAEFAYMIAGAGPTAGRTFELLQFNDKHPATNPVTGNPLAPVPFYSTAQGFSVNGGTQLPTLDLQRVYVLTGTNTCSASEAIMNGLRGADVEVIQIGSTTCGKPYGFYPTDNCGTTYFTIQFRGVNEKNFGDYADGFSPANSTNSFGVSVPGCSVGDDFSKALGDPTEQRLAAALQYRADGTCPAASGSSAPPALSKLTLRADEDPLLSRPQWRQNRLMRR